MLTLLEPKNDYVFKRLFARDPELTLALINDLRPDLPQVESVEILSPTINAAELSGKGIDNQRQQALWRFEMRDATQPDVLLGSELQLTVIELKKTDRLGRRPGSGAGSTGI